MIQQHYETMKDENDLRSKQQQQKLRALSFHHDNVDDDVNFNFDDDDNNEDANHNIDYNNDAATTTAPFNSSSSTKDNYKTPITRYNYIFAFCAALNSCNLGYDVGVNTDAVKLVEESMNLSQKQIEIFVGSLNLFAMIGALCSSSISEKYGRRGGFIFASFGFIIGILLMSNAQSFGFLMFGRIFVGLGVGFGLAIDPMYISEISPAAHRGRLVTWSEIATNVGIELGFCSGLIFYNVPVESAWRVMFGFGSILPVIVMLLAIFVMPESPRWLVKNGKVDDAKDVLRLIYPPGYDVEHVIQEIRDAAERDHEADQLGIKLFYAPTPAFKQMLIVGLGTAMSQQLVGIDGIQYFLHYILDSSGIDGRVEQTLITVGLGMLKLVMIIVAGRLFDTKGRRPLFFASLIGMIISCLFMAVTFHTTNGKNSGGVLSIIGLSIYLSSFSLGMGPGAWLIPSEVFSSTIRSRAMSFATFLNRATATLISSTFLSLSQVLTWAGLFLLLAFTCTLVLIFLYRYLPETKGKTLEDMSLYFANITGDESVLNIERRIKDSFPEEEQQKRIVENNNKSLNPLV